MGTIAEKDVLAGWIAGRKRKYSEDSAAVRGKHFEGAGGMDTVRAFTGLTDEALRKAFDRVGADMGVARDKAGWALAAVGGYGRGELNPYSDIDVMFLVPHGASDAQKEFPSRTLHLLWDLGFNLGYSVRSAEDCCTLVRKDFTILTSLLEARFLTGDLSLFEAFKKKIKANINPKLCDEYIREKLLERTKRHKRHGDSVFLREPNIKEGAGGLRDVHAALWIAKIKYGVEGLEGLYGEEIITGPELRRVTASRNFLLKLRNELHYVSGYKQDVLTFELQETAARDFGYRPRGERLPVEDFMRAYYLRARGVAETTQDVIEKALRPGRRWFVFPPNKRKVGSHFFIMGKNLCLYEKAEDVFRKSPAAAVEAFYFSQVYGARLSDSLKAGIKAGARALGMDGILPPGAGEIFLKIIGRLEGLHDTLDLMHRYKVLSRIIPEFGSITALVQHDMYHKYTVDEHSLIAVKKIGELLTAEGEAYPEFREALLSVKDRQPFLLATLLHDTGKAGGKGHAELGASIARETALRLGMTVAQAEKAEFLVRNHLLMAHVSQRRELSDLKVIEKFCGIVRDRELLDMLYLLTYADMSAVGPELFNDWKRMLLKELYERASAYLRADVSHLAWERERIASARKKIASAAREKGFMAADVEAFLDNFPPAYPLSVPVKTALRHFSLARGLKAGEVIIDCEHRRKGYTDLTIVLHDFLGVLSLAAGALASRNMNIITAQIFTGKDGIIVDTLQVTDYNKKPAHDAQIWEDIKEQLVKVLTGRVRAESLMSGRTAYSRRTALKDIPVRVQVDNEISDKYTVIEIFARDRVGLLFDITRELYRLGCYISSAKVGTDVDQVVDVFYVTDIFRHKVEDAARIEGIKGSLAAVLKTE